METKWLSEVEGNIVAGKEHGQRKDTYRQGPLLHISIWKWGVWGCIGLQNLGSSVSLDKSSCSALCGGSGTQKKVQLGVCHPRYFSCFYPAASC